MFRLFYLTNLASLAILTRQIHNDRMDLFVFFFKFYIKYLSAYRPFFYSLIVEPILYNNNIIFTRVTMLNNNHAM